MNLHPLSRRAKGSIALLATTAFGLALVGPAAFADTNPLVDTTKAPGTLYITKMIQPTPAPTTQANGMQQTPPSSTLNGITFTAYPVLYPNALGVPSPIDLSTPAGWQDAAGGPDANEYDVEGGTSTDPDYTLGTALPACTSTGGGICNITNVPIGLYLVVESEPTTLINDELPVPAAPFLVTLPMTNAAGNGWITDGTGNYAVYLYPKNNLETASKTVDNAASTASMLANNGAVGSTIPYTISANIPTGYNESNPLSAYMVSDVLDSRLTPPADTAVTVTLVPDGTKGPAPVTAATDYTLSTDDYSVTVNGQVIQVTFTTDGLAVLADAAATDDVFVSFSATVNPSLNTQGDPSNGVITNTAVVYPDQDSIDEAYDITGTPSAPYPPAGSIPTPGSPPGAPTNTVQTTYGGIDIHKENANNDGLNGASFQVYAANPALSTGGLDPAATPLTGTTIGNSAASPAIASTTATTFTTGLASQGNDTLGVGEAGILGLQYDGSGTGATSNCQVTQTATTFYNGPVLATDPASTVVSTTSFQTSDANDPAVMYGTTYWVVETVAPTGYELVTDPIPVCLAGVLDGVSDPGYSYDDVIVMNVPHNAGFALPLTGLFNGYLLPLLGAIVVVGGFSVYLVRSRRSAVATGARP